MWLSGCAVHCYVWMLSNLFQYLYIGSCQRIANKVINVSVGGMLLTTASSVCYLRIAIDPTLMEFACFVVSKVQSRVTSIFKFGTLSLVILCIHCILLCAATFLLLWCCLVSYWFTSRVHAKFVCQEVITILCCWIMFYFDEASTLPHCHSKFLIYKKLFPIIFTRYFLVL